MGAKVELVRGQRFGRWTVLGEAGRKHDAVYGRERVINRETYRNRVTNRLLTYKGETHCAVEWAEKLGINVNTIRGRLCRGWSDERTLGTPT